MSDKQQKAPYPLRMPDEMREHLQDAAHANRRSLNAEIVERLEKSINEEFLFGAEGGGESGEISAEELRRVREIMMEAFDNLTTNIKDKAPKKK